MWSNSLGLFGSLLIGAEGTRLLRDKEVAGDPAGAKAPRRLQKLPAESECPERKSTGQLAGTILDLDKIKNCRENDPFSTI
ncbi:hypothetical protein [Neobacillus drentensis]|uniref:hypothetical protein n=1 Tax=Neobacillus drentensis TaxID=220684 RepID=UPI002FFFB295